MTTRCSDFWHGELSCQHGRFHGYVRDRGRVLGVSEPRALARWLRLSALWQPETLEKGARSFCLSRLLSRGIRNRRNLVSGYTQAPAFMVSGHLVCGQSEEWGQCSRFTKSPWPRQVSN